MCRRLEEEEVEPGGDKGHNRRGTVAVDLDASHDLDTSLPLLATSQTRRNYPSRRRLHSRPRRHPRLNTIKRGYFEGCDWSGRRSGRKLRVGHPALCGKDTMGLRSAKSSPLHCTAWTVHLYHFMLFAISTSAIRNVNRSSHLGSSCGPP